MDAQVNFDYDAAGNQINRYVVKANVKSAEELEKNIPEEYRVDDETKVLVYPNPTSGILQFQIVDSSNESNFKTEINIYSVKGDLIQHTQFYSNAFTIDISSEPDGTYFLNVLYNKKIQYFTIIKE